jgi:hypothetical protein
MKQVLHETTVTGKSWLKRFQMEALLQRANPLEW